MLRSLPRQPTVYVTLGTVWNQDLSFFRVVLGSLADRPLNVVAALGPGRDPAELGPQPPNVLVGGFIPHAQLLGHEAGIERDAEVLRDGRPAHLEMFRKRVDGAGGLDEQVEHPAPGRVPDRGPEAVVDLGRHRGAHGRSSSVATYGASRGR